MTTLDAPVMETSPAIQPQRPPGLLKLFVSGPLAFVYPPLARFWLRASLRRAIPIAVFNILSTGLWGVLILVAMYVWVDPKPFRPNGKIIAPALGDFETYRRAALILRDTFVVEWAHTNAFDRISTLIGIPLFVIGALLLPYFVILPFGARPGPNKPAMLHVARTVLLGSGLIHWWGAAYVATFLIYAASHVSHNITYDYPTFVPPLLLVFAGLTIWTLAVLILAVRREYRTAADFPEPHDPWCDDCGYILTGIDPAGRCPECGRLIADSLGPPNRHGSPQFPQALGHGGRIGAGFEARHREQLGFRRQALAQQFRGDACSHQVAVPELRGLQAAAAPEEFCHPADLFPSLRAQRARRVVIAVDGMGVAHEIDFHGVARLKKLTDGRQVHRGSAGRSCVTIVFRFGMPAAFRVFSVFRGWQIRRE